MNNEELGDTFNKAITRLAPTALDTLWPEIEPEVTNTVMQVTTLSFCKFYFKRHHNCY